MERGGFGTEHVVFEGDVGILIAGPGPNNFRTGLFMIEPVVRNRGWLLRNPANPYRELVSGAELIVVDLDPVPRDVRAVATIAAAVHIERKAAGYV